MIFVHHHVNERLPDWVQEYQIAEEFVQANQGMHRQRARLNKISAAVGLLIGFFGMLAMVRVVHDFVLYLVIAVPLCFALIRVGRLTVWAGWAWWFIRQTDRNVAEVLGWDHVSAVLQWYRDQPARPDLWWARRSLHWLLKGCAADSGGSIALDSAERPIGNRLSCATSLFGGVFGWVILRLC